MRKIVSAFQSYVKTYPDEAHYLEYMDKTFIFDMLYGLGLAVDREEFYGASGFEKFQNELRRMMGPRKRSTTNPSGKQE